MMTYPNVLFLFAFLLLSNMLNAFPNSQPYIIGGYYDNSSQYRSEGDNRPSFTMNMIDPNMLTDLYYAFAGFGYIVNSTNPKDSHLTGDFTIQLFDEKDQRTGYQQIKSLKQRSKHEIRVFLSVGGWNFNDPNDLQGNGQKTYRLFSQMVSLPANRKQFISSAIDYAHRYGFDGIDIDWEYPGDLKRGGREEDFENFIQFLKECSQAFAIAKPQLLLSYTVPAAIPVGVSQKFHENAHLYFKWMAECAQYVDRINVMAYDYHTPFDVPKITGVNSPLNRDTDPTSVYYIAKTIQNYLDHGIPSRKIVLGLPLFGHSYAGVKDLSLENTGPGKSFETPGAPGISTRQAGLLAYFEIADMISKKQLMFSTDQITDTAYGYHINSKQWVSFDTPETIKLKAQFALDKNLRGVIFWSVDMDEYQWEPKFPNIRSARKIFYLTPK